jgi:hypothetical protein
LLEEERRRQQLIADEDSEVQNDSNNGSNRLNDGANGFTQDIDPIREEEENPISSQNVTGEANPRQ